MTDEEKAQHAADLATEIDERLTALLNELSEKSWMAIDGEKEPERFALEKEMWSKALMVTLARQLGVIEAMLVLTDNVEMATIAGIREEWIQKGHQITIEAVEAQRAEDEEN